MDVNLCQLKELNLFCMGCCGHDFTTREEIELALKNNTLSFFKYKDKIKWRCRASDYVRCCGLCYNIIKDGDEVYCPLHPEKNDGLDLRDENCEIDYMCKTYLKFKLWDDSMKKYFLEFLKSKNLDWYEYSTGMDSGSLLKDFKESLKR